jgi:YfiH family protein
MEALRHELLPVEHGFGVRGMPRPEGLVQPKQVHGAGVARVEQGAALPAEADAIVTAQSGVCIGVVTADCVPILVSAEDGSAVAAIHAGWRGLAAGVIEAGVSALRAETDASLVAVIGPHIGACCYEVDAPVIGGLHARFGDQTDAALRAVATKPGHAMLELAKLAEVDLERAGLRPGDTARLEVGGAAACTQCDAERFDSYRRDGEAAGRLMHFIRLGAA